MKINNFPITIEIHFNYVTLKLQILKYKGDTNNFKIL